MIATSGLRSASTISALPSLIPDTGDTQVEAREALQFVAQRPSQPWPAWTPGRGSSRAQGLLKFLRASLGNDVFLTAISTESTKLT